MTHRLTALLAAAAIVTGAAGTAAAAPLTLNVDFGFKNVNVFSGAGAAPGAGTLWNGLDFTGGNNLPDSNGLPTGIDVHTTASQAFSDSGHPLLRDRVFVTGSWGPFTVTINDLTGSLYDLYVYGSNTRYASVSTVGTVSDYALGTQTVGPGGFGHNTHYALLQGLTPIGGTITINVSRYTGSQAAVIGGLQLQEVSQVPEPGSLLLLGTGLAGAVRAIRKRRQ